MKFQKSFTRPLIYYIDKATWATIRCCMDPFYKAYFLNVSEAIFFKCILESQPSINKVALNMRCHTHTSRLHFIPSRGLLDTQQSSSKLITCLSRGPLATRLLVNRPNSTKHHKKKKNGNKEKRNLYIWLYKYCNHTKT